MPLPGLVATPLGQGCSSALRTHCRYCFALSFGVCVFPDSALSSILPFRWSFRAKNRERDVPACPGDRGVFDWLIRLLRGAETPERLERPRPAARRRNATCRDRETTRDADRNSEHLSLDGLPPTSNTIVIPFESLLRGALTPVAQADGGSDKSTECYPRTEL